MKCYKITKIFSTCISTVETVKGKNIIFITWWMYQYYIHGIVKVDQVNKSSTKLVAETVHRQSHNL